MIREDLNKLDVADFKPVKGVNNEQKKSETDEKITVKNYYNLNDL